MFCHSFTMQRDKFNLLPAVLAGSLGSCKGYATRRAECYLPARVEGNRLKARLKEAGEIAVGVSHGCEAVARHPVPDHDSRLGHRREYTALQWVEYKIHN